MKMQVRRCSGKLHGWPLWHRPPEPSIGQPKAPSARDLLGAKSPSLDERLRQRGPPRRGQKHRRRTGRLRCSQDLYQQLEGRGAPKSPSHSELHASGPTSKCFCSRLRSIDDKTSCCRETSVEELHSVDVSAARWAAKPSATIAAAQGAKAGLPEGA